MRVANSGGYGRVGRLIGHALDRRGFSYTVIEQDRRLVEELRCRGITALHGDAGNHVFLEHAHVASARLLVVAFDDPPTIRHLVSQARNAAHPGEYRRPTVPPARLAERTRRLRRVRRHAAWGVAGQHTVDDARGEFGRLRAGWSTDRPRARPSRF